MWESPIKMISNEMQTQLEGEVFKAVQRVGIDVDKDELIKALNYDRKQYEKGLLEGYAKAKGEIIRCKDCKYSHLTYSGKCKYCDQWVDEDGFSEKLYLDGDFYCAYAERREDE